MPKVTKKKLGVQLSMFPVEQDNTEKVVDSLCFEVFPSKEGRYKVLPYIDLECVKCHNSIESGRWVYPIGLCYKCAQKNALKEAYLSRARSEKMDKQFELTVSEESEFSLVEAVKIWLADLKRSKENELRAKAMAQGGRWQASPAPTPRKEEVEYGRQGDKLPPLS